MSVVDIACVAKYINKGAYGTLSEENLRQSFDELRAFFGSSIAVSHLAGVNGGFLPTLSRAFALSAYWSRSIGRSKTSNREVGRVLLWLARLEHGRAHRSI